MKLIFAVLVLLENKVEARGGLVEGLFCGIENCYNVLGFDLETEVRTEITNKQIKSKYKNLAKNLHPDRFVKSDTNDEEKAEIEEKFKRVGKAFETLKGEAREEYDDFLDNPEKYYIEYYQYYRGSVPYPSVNLSLVLVMCAVTVSVVQWFGWNANYDKALLHMYTVDKYRVAAKREAEERKLFGDKKSNKGKTQIQVKEEEKKIIMEIIAEKIDIRGGYQKPVYTDLFIIQLCFYPLYFARYIMFHLRWFCKFNLLKHPFGEEEKLIMIKKHLSPESNSAWEEMLDKNKEEFLTRGLWIKIHADDYIKEQEEKERLDKANSGKWKQYRRYMKSDSAQQTMTFED